MQDRAPGRCPRCQSPSYRARPALLNVKDDLAIEGPRRRAVGWYDDPAGRYPMRWWDGDRWSPKVLIDGRVAVDLNPTGLAEVWEHPAHLHASSG
jgi:hypothetical protein